MCGSQRIQVVRLPVDDGSMVAAEACLNCGERYYSRAAAEAILAARKTSKRRRVP